MAEKIAFIGLGNMGLPMASNLLKAGHAVQGFDVVPAANAAAAKAGISIAASPAEAVKGADAVISMLPNGKLVLEVYGGGIVQAATPGTLFIDSSTIDVASARAAHDLAASAGMISLDAPVSGGVGGAAAGTLTFMAGGVPEAFARAKSILEAMGRKIVHCGGAGAGQAAKICNNMILGISMIAVGEAFVLGEKLGLSHQALFDVASTASGQCWSLTTNCPVPGPVTASPANNGYKPGFAAALMLKDLLLSQEAASSTGAATALGGHAAEIYRDFVSAGHGGTDFSAIINAIRSAPMMTTYETLLAEPHGAVTLLRLNRPQALNALNTQVLADLIAAFAAYDADTAQRCLVLTGSEKAFAAGADIKEMQPKGFSAMYAENFFAGFEKVTGTRKPWLAAVAGFALGGGCELAMMADFIIAADNARFGQPEIKLGVAPGMGGSQRLTRAIGKAKAMEMCLTGRMMDAAEAERAGLVARVVPQGELIDDALKTAQTIAAMPPLAAIANKEMVNAAFETGLAQGILFERRLFNGLCSTQDKQEGMSSFVEKRQGVWTGT